MTVPRRAGKLSTFSLLRRAPLPYTMPPCMVGVPLAGILLSPHRQSFHHSLEPPRAYFVSGEQQRDTDTQEGTNDPEGQGERPHIDFCKQVQGMYESK